MTTTTLAGNITSLGAVLQEYFQVLITNFWPIMIGILVLLGVVGAVFYAVKRLFGHKH